MNKLLNYRPLLIFAFSLIVGGYLMAFKLVPSVFIVIASLMLITIIVVTVYYIHCKKPVKWLVKILALILVPAIISGFAINQECEKRKQPEGLGRGEYVITGTVLNGGTNGNINYILLY